MLQAAGLQVEVFSALKANPVGANLAAALDPLCQ